MHPENMKAAKKLIPPLWHTLEFFEARWNSEARHEKFHEYESYMQKHLAELNPEARFVALTKEPFAVCFELKGDAFRIALVNGRIHLAEYKQGQVFFREYPTVEFPEGLRELGFQDQSWHNDAAAWAWHEGKKVGVWCDHEAPDEREMKGPKYSVCRTDKDGYPLAETPLFQAEAVGPVVEFLKREVFEGKELA